MKALRLRGYLLDAEIPKNQGTVPLVRQLCPSLGYAVGNVYYRNDGTHVMCMFWEGERRGAS
jgi:hypothetical protein